LIRLDRPITSVFIADTEIADVGTSQQLITPRQAAGDDDDLRDGRSDIVLASVTLVTHNLGS
jgi:hypothetical protein